MGLVFGGSVGACIEYALFCTFDSPDFPRGVLRLALLPHLSPYSSFGYVVT